MDLKQILYENDRVYVDNCKLREVMNAPLSNEEKSKLVVTSSVKNEFLAQQEVSPEEESVLKAFCEPTIHKLAYASEKAFRTYLAANYLFNALSLGTFRNDMNNEVHKKIHSFVQNYKFKEFTGNLVEEVSKLGLACVGFIAPVYFKNSFFNFMTKRAKKDYDAKVANLKNEKNSDELLAGATKKRKTWIKRNIDNIFETLGTRKTLDDAFFQKTSFNPIEGYNYTDQDLITHAAIDAAINHENIGIYTEDGDCLGLFDALQEICGMGQDNNFAIYRATIKRKSQKTASIPNPIKIFHASENYLKNKTKNDEILFRRALFQHEQYPAINRNYELFQGLLSGVTGSFCLCCI